MVGGTRAVPLVVADGAVSASVDVELKPTTS
jgi:hypothetical protein